MSDDMLAAALDAALAELRAGGGSDALFNLVVRERDAARADAERLAEVLEHAPVAIDQTEQTAAWEVKRTKALRQHEEAIK